jgi:hypothetical protein
MKFHKEKIVRVSDLNEETKKKLIDELLDVVIHECPLITMGDKKVYKSRLGCKDCPETLDLKKNISCWIKYLVGDCQK